MSKFRRRLISHLRINNISTPTPKEYFTIEALGDGLTAKLSLNVCEYCVDGDGIWKTLQANTLTESINTGQTLSFRGNLVPDSTNGIGTFTITKKCNLRGNPLSLIYGDDFVDYLNSAYPNNAFKNLFNSCTNLVDASSLQLTGIASSEGCFSGLFKSCTSLTKAPTLPSLVVGKYSYQNLFNGCTSLKVAPELLATTLAYGSYAGMFEGCSNLEKAPTILPATDLTGCTYCYQWMFYGCSKLTIAPIILAEKLETYCCRYMFMYCTNLIKAPTILPAITMKNYCYHNMFHDCSNLLTAPILLATSLTTECYQSMFKNCNKLKHIIALATNSTGLSSWTMSVASSGIFIKSKNSTIGTGSSGIPNNWTVYNYVNTDSCKIVDYILTNGEAYIDTEYFVNPNTEIEITYLMSYNNNSNINTSGTNIGNAIFTAKEQDYNYSVNHGADAGQINTFYLWSDKSYSSGGSIYNIESTVDKPITLSYKYVDGVYCCVCNNSTVSIATPTHTYTENTLKIAAYLGDEIYNRTDMKIFDFKIYENGILLKQFVPAENNNIYGMVDIIGGKFHASPNGKSFNYL